jgi:cytochrome b
MAQTGLQRQRVYDPVLRLIHAWNALAILILLFSGQFTDWLGRGATVAPFWQAHVWAGYALLLGLYARIVWGVIGPPPARLGALWQPCQWRHAWYRRHFFVAPSSFGHHPVASLIYLVVYALLLGMLASGLILAASAQNTGPLYTWLGHASTVDPLARAPHGWGAYLLWLFLFTHLAALILHPRRHGLPVAQAMISGYQYLKEK